MQIKIQADRFPKGWYSLCEVDHQTTYTSSDYPHDIDVSIIKLFKQFGVDVSKMFKGQNISLVLNLEESTNVTKLF